MICRLVLKGFFRLMDDKFVEAIHLDVCLEYALRLKSVEVGLASDKTFSRFRGHLYVREKGEDLLEDCVRSMFAGLIKFMGIST